MKRKATRGRTARTTKHAAAEESQVFVVPSHGRLARRGSTQIVEDESEESRGRVRDRDGQAA